MCDFKENIQKYLDNGKNTCIILFILLIVEYLFA